MNVLLLAAEKGECFTSAGYQPKPLIDVNGKPMWRFVLDNFLEQFFWPGKTNVYVATKAEYDINPQIEPYHILRLYGPQFGAAWSAYDALDMSACNVDEPLIVLNCDQVIKYNGKSFWQSIIESSSQGSLLHFYEPNKETKWGRSILGTDDLLIQKIVEKEPVSPFAHTGHYFWAKTSDFFKYAQIIFEKDIKVNGEYFISPIYNLMIEDGKQVSSFFVSEFHGIGIPEDLERFRNV